MSSQPAFAPVEKTTISSARLIVSASQIWAWVVRLLPDEFSSPRLTTPNAAPLTTMSKGKVDVSFIKHVATNDDFQREVIDHGKDNLLVSVRPARRRPVQRDTSIPFTNKILQSGWRACIHEDAACRYTRGGERTVHLPVKLLASEGQGLI